MILGGHDKSSSDYAPPREAAERIIHSLNGATQPTKIWIRVQKDSVGQQGTHFCIPAKEEGIDRYPCCLTIHHGVCAVKDLVQCLYFE